jgi:hypothetical protein
LDDKHAQFEVDAGWGGVSNSRLGGTGNLPVRFADTGWKPVPRDGSDRASNSRIASPLGGGKASEIATFWLLNADRFYLYTATPGTACLNFSTACWVTLVPIR